MGNILGRRWLSHRAKIAANLEGQENKIEMKQEIGKLKWQNNQIMRERGKEEREKRERAVRQFSKFIRIVVENPPKLRYSCIAMIFKQSRKRTEQETLDDFITILHDISYLICGILYQKATLPTLSSR